MAERSEIMKIVEACERYWLDTAVPATAVTEMRTELEGHLAAAVAEGKEPEAVVGPDVHAFAEDWAAVYRTPHSPAGAGPGSRSQKTRPSIWITLGVFIGVIATVAVAAVAGPKEETVDIEVWRWVWAGAALILAVGEMLTAGFFMLPFAVGAIAAAFLAWLNVSVTVQLIVFIVVSVLSLIGLQRFVRHEDEHKPAVGANRFLERTATVIEDVDRIGGAGRVRMDTEEWRATTDGDEPIEEGVEVRVVDVRGTRLVVERIVNS